MDVMGDVKEQTIKNMVEEQEELLYALISVIDNLVDRNPRPGEATKQPEDSPNVFDDIMNRLRHCRGLVREATEKMQMGITNKVL